MTTATVTFCRSLNFGTILQMYALQRALVLNGIDNVIVDYVYHPHARKYQLFRIHAYVSSPFTFVKDVVTLRQRYRRTKRIEDFLRKWCRFTDQRYRTFESLKGLVDQYDAFICGSDQIWNTALTFGVAPAFFLDFAKGSGKLTLAYGPSLGHPHVDARHVQDFCLAAKGIDYLSVRDCSSVHLVERLTGKAVCSVVDPTLLLTQQEWSRVEEQATLHCDYTLVYMLGIDRRVVDYVNDLSKSRNLRVVHFNYVNPWFRNAINMSDTGPGDFLNLIRHARYVVTNSFHGTALAVLYRKRFRAFMPKRFSSRIVDFLRVVELEDRLDSSGESIDAPIDYDRVSASLENARGRSLRFLIENLKGPLQEGAVEPAASG